MGKLLRHEEEKGSILQPKLMPKSKGFTIQSRNAPYHFHFRLNFVMSLNTMQQCQKLKENSICRANLFVQSQNLIESQFVPRGSQSWKCLSAKCKPPSFIRCCYLRPIRAPFFTEMRKYVSTRVCKLWANKPIARGSVTRSRFELGLPSKLFFFCISCAQFGGFRALIYGLVWRICKIGSLTVN